MTFIQRQPFSLRRIEQRSPDPRIYVSLIPLVFCGSDQYISIILKSLWFSHFQSPVLVLSSSVLVPPSVCYSRTVLCELYGGVAFAYRRNSVIVHDDPCVTPTYMHRRPHQVRIPILPLTRYSCPHVSNRMQLDAAIAKLLGVNAEQTSVDSAGGGGCSSAKTSKITTRLDDGARKTFFMKTGNGDAARIMFEGREMMHRFSEPSRLQGWMCLIGF